MNHPISLRFSRTACLTALAVGATLALSQAQAAAVSLETLHAFDAATEGKPQARPLWADGKVYGVTRVGSTAQGAIYRYSTTGDSFGIAHTFATEQPAGSANQYPLTLGSDGAVYGARASSPASSAVGRLFRMDPANEAGIQFTNLDDGAGKSFSPISALVVGSDGRLYGATYNEVFRVDTDGTDAEVFYANGYSPSGLAGRAPNGALLGVASFGANAGTSAIAADGQSRVLLAATLKNSTPTGLFIDGGDGKLYGTDKGVNVVRFGTTADSLETLYTFTSPDGFSWPQGNIAQNYLARGYDGKFYGVTYMGGAHDKGVLYRIDASAAAGQRYEKLYDFGGNATDGEYPGGLIQGKDGYLYGSTMAGGAGAAGTLFRVDAGIEPPKPSITRFESSAATVEQGGSVTLSWTAVHAASCVVTATGYDSGAQPADGTLSVTPASEGSVRYTLRCEGTGDFADDSASEETTLTVTAPRGGKGGGAPAPVLLGLLVAAALWRRRHG